MRRNVYSSAVYTGGRPRQSNFTWTRSSPINHSWHQKTRDLATRWRRPHPSAFPHFDTIPVCDGRTDGFAVAYRLQRLRRAVKNICLRLETPWQNLHHSSLNVKIKISLLNGNHCNVVKHTRQRCFSNITVVNTNGRKIGGINNATVTMPFKTTEKEIKAPSRDQTQPPARPVACCIVNGQRRWPVATGAGIAPYLHKIMAGHRCCCVFA